MSSKLKSFANLVIIITFVILPFLPAKAVIERVINHLTFSDVESTDVELLYLAEAGVIQGYSDGTVRSESLINRAETLTVFSRMLGLAPVYDANCTFSDVGQDFWYSGYVSAMCNAGLILGNPDGTFRPADTLNRAEAMTILVRSLNVQIPEYPANLAPDIPEGVWYQDYANYVIDRNLVPLVNGEFMAAKRYTRGDIFINIYRVKRLQELGTYRYSRELDPLVVEENSLNPNQNTNVAFAITGTQRETSDYFSEHPLTFVYEGDRGNGRGFDPQLPPPNTYKQAAFNLVFSWRSELKRILPFPLRFDFQLIQRATTLEGYDFNDLIKDFYRELGLNIDSHRIEDSVTRSDVDIVLNNIIRRAKSVEKPVNSLKISFSVIDSHQIKIVYNMILADQGNVVPVNFQLFDNSTGLLVHEENLGGVLTAQALQEIRESGNEFPYGVHLPRLDGTSDKTLFNDAYTYFYLNLPTGLEEGTRYTLKVSSLLFVRYAKDPSAVPAVNQSKDSWDFVYLNGSQFEFDRNSALEFTYNNPSERIPTGIALDFDYFWQRSWGLPLDNRVALYDQNNSLIDINEPIQWTVIQGGGHVETNDKGLLNYIPDSRDDVVILRANVYDFSAEATIHFVDNVGV